MLAIVREERQLSDLNERLKDAEPDLPVHYSLAKTLEETKDAKQRSHRQLTERCVFDHRVCIFLSLSLSSALTFFTDGTLSLYVLRKRRQQTREILRSIEVLWQRVRVVRVG